MTVEQEDNAVGLMTRRGVVLHKLNPFMEGGAVVTKSKTKRVTNKRGDMMIMGETGEIVAGVAGFCLLYTSPSPRD